jgi:hypothetical protein
MAWLVDPAAAAFLEVGAFVAVLLAVFGRLQHRSGRAVTTWLVRHRGLGPLVGAALGVLPGCGGAIVVMPVYLHGTVSFGTVVATLVATMGDASFVLLATHPVTAIGVHLALLVVGVATGLAADALRIAPARATALQRVAPDRLTVTAAAGLVGTEERSAPARGPDIRQPRGARAAAEGQPPRPGGDAPPRGRSGTLLEGVTLLFWILVAVGGTIAVLRLLGSSATAVAATGDPTVDLGITVERIVGLTGVVCCVAVLLLGRGQGAALGCTALARPGGVLRAAARETAIVVCWVAVAFVVVELVVAATGLDLARLPVVGLVGVLVGAALGLVPGCGPQLVLTGLYAQGLVPLPMLLANALSQDGDALLPLLVLDRRAALLGTGVSTIPGVLVGSVLVGLGW